MNTIALKNGYTLRIIPNGMASPMQDHGVMELAADDDARTFYAHAVMAATYGTDSLKAACIRYVALPPSKWRQASH